MIALNEVVENPEKFKKTYEKLGRHAKIDKIVILAGKFKHYGNLAQEARSSCNKLAPKIAELKLNNAEKTVIDSTLSEIVGLDRQAIKLTKKYKRFERKINRRLCALPNIPDEFIQQDVVISSAGAASNFAEFEEWLHMNFRAMEPVNKTKNALAAFSGYVFGENELPFMLICGEKRSSLKEFRIIVADGFLDDVVDKILSFLAENSLNITRRSSYSLKKSSCDEYVVKLNGSQSLQIEVKREFNTRKFNIKYKNTKFDRNQFVDEIAVFEQSSSL